MLKESIEGLRGLVIT